jgi:tRNA (cytidine/uridine-2'-O-)-methyltransferase
MFSLILYEPEIPPNTGNIIRLCANTGVGLHLVEPLGFELDEPRLKRAGLDYREFARVATHASLEACLDSLGDPRLFALSTRAGTRHDSADYKSGDAFLFGPETRGLPQEVLESVPPERRLRLPMKENSRSLNLSNSAAVVVYEAWRQLGFAGGRKVSCPTVSRDFRVSRRRRGQARSEGNIGPYWLRSQHRSGAFC